MIKVVIPYIGVEAQGNELELALAGWFRHFKADFRIYVVGDRHPSLDRYGKDVVYLKCDRVQQYDHPYQYIPHLDIARKVDMFLTLEQPDSFVFCADDVYAVQDFNMDDIRIPKFKAESIPSISPLSHNKYAIALGRTHDLLREMAQPDRCYETHMPRLFERKPYNAIVKYFNLLDKDYIVGDLYDNLVRPMAPRKELFAHDRLCRWILNYGLQEPSYEEVCKDVAQYNPIWINNGTQGWGPGLQRYLKEHYNIQ